MSAPWSVQDAKARLSEVLRRARAGEPQRIGTKDSCVVVSAEDWASLRGASLGAWLVETAPHGEPLDVAPRTTKRGDPFAEEPDP
jgi:prevent-host-death family protein